MASLSVLLRHLVFVSVCTYMVTCVVGSMCADWQLIRSNENSYVLCANNSPISIIQTSRDEKSAIDSNWHFCCGRDSNQTASPRGDWIYRHSAYYQSFNLNCSDKQYVSGIQSNVSDFSFDRIWTIHCTDLPSHLFLDNCSWIYAGLTYFLNFSVSLPHLLTGIRSIYDRYVGREWYFRVCIQKAYCSPGAQAQLPGGGLAFEVNSSLNFVCPVGSFLSGPSAIACSHLLNTTIISHCEVCKQIHLCQDHHCSSSDYSICDRCIDYHPKWNIPVIANQRRRKCRVPPVIFSPEKEIKFVRGESISLPCDCRGIPAPKIQWFFNNTPTQWGIVDDYGSLFMNSSLVTSLLLSDVNLEGNYSCVVRNNFGQDSVTMKLSQIIRTTLHRTTSIIAIEGEEVVLSCPFGSYEEIQWLNCSESRRDFQELTNNTYRVSLLNNSQTMQISPVNHPDAGVYVCRGVHGRSVIVLAVILHVISQLLMEISGSGISPSTAPKFTNWTPLYAVSEGSNVELICEAVSSPLPPIVYWQHKERILLAGRGRVAIVFENVSTSMSGEYTCTANSIDFDKVTLKTLLLVAGNQPTTTESSTTESSTTESSTTESSTTESSTTESSTTESSTIAGSSSSQLWHPLLLLTAIFLLN